MKRTNANSASALAEPLSLPCGIEIKNRLMKSAMSEILGTVDNRPTESLCRLYNTFAWGGVGIAVTGNVMVDPNALGEPRNVVIEDDRDLAALEAWANAGKANNAHIWVQLNHPGKQSPKSLSPEPVAPSAIPFSAPTLRKFFNPPRELSPEEINTIIQRFAGSAAVVQKAGFTGVQIHAAHGYLISQFLSPQHNQRRDEWGGSIENRMRFLLEILGAIRTRVGEDFPVSVKLNSADFMHGGFSEEEALVVVTALAEAGIDLIEVSGGTYESPAMAGRKTEKTSTAKREAYFLSFAAKIKQTVKTPLAVTGGFRTSAGMTAAVAAGETDLVGLARPLAVDPDLPAKILSGEAYTSSVKPLKTGLSWLDKSAMLEVTWYEQQLARLAAGKPTQPDESVWLSLAKTMFTTGFQVFQKRRG